METIFVAVEPCDTDKSSEPDNSIDVEIKSEPEDIHEENCLSASEIYSSNDEESCSNTEENCIQSELLIDIKEEPDEDIGHEEESDENTHKSQEPQIYRQSDSDEDYVPPNFLQKQIKKAQSNGVKQSKVKPKIVNISKNPSPVTIKLENFKRTYRIGRCIFKDCIEDCISLIPRAVRRQMLMEHNLYVPRLSRVCEDHLMDQNWEDLLTDTTSEFTALHCQDMKDVIHKACQTNFDFEYIETVESRLVRYWFDVNKTEFNRIFNEFPILKRLKHPKTAFALYLMFLQNKDFDRIALLLKLKRKTVKKRIRIVKCVVRCENYNQLKDKFLDDD